MKVDIRFIDELNTLLPAKKRNRTLSVEWNGKRPVKDLVESLCVPHTEVGAVRVNDRWVSLSYILRDGDDITVSPAPPAGKNLSEERFLHLQRLFPINTPTFCTTAHIEQNTQGDSNKRRPCLLCDVHLWKLVRRLRLLGFDTAYDAGWDDAKLAAVSEEEGRVLLSRDRGLLMRKQVTRGIYVYSTYPEEQVTEVLKRLGVRGSFAVFTRCLLCNGFLEAVDTAGEDFDVRFKPLIPPGVLKWAKEYQFCPTCEKVFWKGSHYDKLLTKIENYLKS